MKPQPTEQLSLHEVADLLGVHYMTVYRYVRLGILPARREGRAWRVLRDDVEAFSGGEEPRAARGEVDWADRFFNRIIVPDEAGAWGVVEAALSSGMSMPEAYTEILAVSLRRVGEAWSRGDIDVATEHAASEVVTRIVARLGPRMARRGLKRGTVVLGSTAAELHSLPLAMAADLFRAAQFEAIDLGANLPAESFASFLARTDGVVAVAIGVTTPGQEDGLAETMAAVRGVTDVPIVVGGSGVDEATALTLGADAWADTGDAAVAVVQEALGAFGR